jgi:RNA polymerase sigma-70 factor (ECF subfamily)
LYQRHVDRVYSYIAFRVRDTALAEDLTQEVFLHALRALGSFNFRGALAPWLMSIARNAVVDHWRRRSRRPEDAISTLSGDTEEEEGLIDRLSTEVGGGFAADAVGTLRGELGAEEHAEFVLTRERVARAAVNLTELQQQVLALRFSAGLSVKETADAMSRSEGAVKNLQHHALKALKRHLGE